MELQQIGDLRAEAGELYGLLAALPDAEWARPTQFKRWTVNDIIQHLHVGDRMGAAAAQGSEVFATLRADMRARLDAGLTGVEEARERLGNPTGARLLALWHSQLAALCDTLAAMPTEARLPWAGPDMGVRMFTTARQMETWAHGQAIYDMLGIERPAAAPRLRNIAELGVRTFGWAYRIRGLPVPEVMPYIRLDTQFGATWEWNQAATDNAITGDSCAFCQVVAQTRNVADTSLSVIGATAQAWMAIVQCFAGPPETPPAPGTRSRMSRAI